MKRVYAQPMIQNSKAQTGKAKTKMACAKGEIKK